MPPLRRSQRQTKAAAAAEEEGIRTREKKRREICSHHHMPSAHMDLPSMASGIQSNDSKLQLDANTHLLNLFSLENNPLISEVIQSGAVPRLVEFLKRHDDPQLQCIAVRVLKNIASGTSENTKVVIDCGAVPLLVKLLDSSELDTCEQVVWCLGNISGESVQCCNVVLNCGALHPLLNLLEKHKILSFRRIGTWTLANFLEGGPKVPSEQVEFASCVLASLLLETDEEILKEACWALSYLCHCGGGIETAMYEAGICHKLARVSHDVSACVMYPATRAVRTILAGSAMDRRADQMWSLWKLITSATDGKDTVANCIRSEISSVVSILRRWLLFNFQSTVWKVETPPLRKGSSPC